MRLIELKSIKPSIALGYTPYCSFSVYKRNKYSVLTMIELQREQLDSSPVSSHVSLVEGDY